jgi:hypothetical protein
MALSDMLGASRGETFESQVSLHPSMGIGFLSSSSKGRHIPAFSGDAVGPDLSIIPLRVNLKDLGSLNSFGQPFLGFC